MRTPALAIFATVICLAADNAAADPCREYWRDGRAVHAELQRKAIDELNRNDHAAACKTMQELTKLSQEMRAFLERSCRGNEGGKRRVAAADNIAVRTKEICAQAGR